MRKIKNACTIFIRKPEEKRPVGKTGNWWRIILNCTLKRTGHEDLMCSETSTEYSGGLL
jgi:hypothetical protein